MCNNCRIAGLRETFVCLTILIFIRAMVPIMFLATCTLCIIPSFAPRDTLVWWVVAVVVHVFMCSHGSSFTNAVDWRLTYVMTGPLCVSATCLVLFRDWTASSCLLSAYVLLTALVAAYVEAYRLRIRLSFPHVHTAPRAVPVSFPRYHGS